MNTLQMTLFAVVIGSAVAMVVVALYLGARGRSANIGDAVPDRNQMRPYTLWGLFYINPADPRGWVPKPYGWGWTVNVRSRGWVWLIVSLFFLTIIAAVTLAMTARR